MFSESLYAGMGWISPKYVEDDHDTLADSLPSHTGHILLAPCTPSDRSRQSTTNSSVSRTEITFVYRAMMSLARSLQHGLIGIPNSLPQVHLKSSALQQDSNFESSI